MMIPPAKFKVLLHYYYSPEDYEPQGDLDAVVDGLIYHDMLKENDTDCSAVTGNYVITDRGKYYIEACLSTPFPETKFYIPKKGTPDAED